MWIVIEKKENGTPGYLPDTDPAEFEHETFIAALDIRWLRPRPLDLRGQRIPRSSAPQNASDAWDPSKISRPRPVSSSRHAAAAPYALGQKGTEE